MCGRWFVKDWALPETLEAIFNRGYETDFPKNYNSACKMSNDLIARYAGTHTEEEIAVYSESLWNEYSVHGTVAGQIPPDDGKKSFPILLNEAIAHKPDAVLALGEWCQYYNPLGDDDVAWDVSRPFEPAHSYHLCPVYDSSQDDDTLIGFRLTDKKGDEWTVCYPNKMLAKDFPSFRRYIGTDVWVVFWLDSMNMAGTDLQPWTIISLSDGKTVFAHPTKTMYIENFAGKEIVFDDKRKKFVYEDGEEVIFGTTWD